MNCGELIQANSHSKSSKKIEKEIEKIKNKTINIKNNNKMKSTFPESLSVWYTNADVLTKDKIIELMDLINNSTQQPHIIAICEVKPKNYNRQLMEIEYKIDNYTFVHENLEDPTQTRGVGVYVHKSLGFQKLSVNTIAGKNQKPPREALTIEINLINQEKMMFGVVYRSPSSSTEENNNINELFKSLGKMHKYHHKIIVGDFNRKNINWTNLSSTSQDDMNFIEAIRDSYLLQLVSGSTRGRGTNEPSLIDLVFANSSENIDDISTSAPLGKSDHSVLKFDYLCLPDQQPDKYISNFRKANFEKFKEHLSINWNELFEDCNGNVDIMWDKFLTVYTDAEKNCIPKKRVQIGKRNFHFNLDRKALTKRKRKNRLWKRFIATKEQNIYEEYCKCRNQLRRLTRMARKNGEKEIAKKVKSNCKAFWTYVNSKTKIKSSIPDLAFNTTEENTRYTKNDQEKANILAKFFSSVFVNEPSLQETVSIEMNNNKTDLFINLTRKQVLEKLKQLNVTKSPGPDQIHPRVAKEMADYLAEPLYLIFKASLDTGKVPSTWKMANITAIFKKGERHLAGNYRPVSLTSIVCKMLESIIRDNMIAYLKENEILSDRQFGFLAGRSTTLQLLHVMDKWVNIVENGGMIDSIYCDFRKAFDTVPHKRLIIALKKIGVKDPILSWMIDYLNCRTQRVQVNGYMSETFKVTSGVPQGSVLGPLLFVIYINTLVKRAENSELYLYADDLKLFKEINSIEDTEKLQQDLDNLYNWTQSSLLQFHPDKCEVLRINPKKKHQVANAVYKINGEALKTVKDVDDLGITFSENLSFEDHILKKVKKANTLAGMIRRTFSYLDKDTFKLLFVSIVRPHLEYGAPIWSPHHKRLIKIVENVQRRATKLLPGMADLSYEERLKVLQLPTLEYRRYRGDMIETYKMTHGLYDVDITRKFLKERSENKYNIRMHEYAVAREIWKTNLKRNAFKCRITDQWNNLSSHIVNAPTLNTFKNRLDQVWKSEDRMFKTEIDFQTVASARRNRYIQLKDDNDE